MERLFFFSKQKKLLLGSIIGIGSFVGHKHFFCSEKREKQEITIREELDEPKRTPKKKREGLPIGVKMSLIAGGVLGGLGLLVIPFLSPALRRLSAPFLPANDSLKESMIQYCIKHNKKNMVDLGSGDGIIVIDAAKKGMRGTGYELNVWLVMWSKWKALRNGVSGMTSFKRKDLWKVDLSQFDAILFCGVPDMMPMLEKKLLEEMRADAIFVSGRFPLESWAEFERNDGEDAVDVVFVYRQEDLGKERKEEGEPVRRKRKRLVKGKEDKNSEFDNYV